MTRCDRVCPRSTVSTSFFFPAHEMSGPRGTSTPSLLCRPSCPARHRPLSHDYHRRRTHRSTHEYAASPLYRASAWDRLNARAAITDGTKTTVPEVEYEGEGDFPDEVSVFKEIDEMHLSKLSKMCIQTIAETEGTEAKLTYLDSHINMLFDLVHNPSVTDAIRTFKDDPEYIPTPQDIDEFPDTVYADAIQIVRALKTNLVSEYTDLSASDIESEHVLSQLWYWWELPLHPEAW